MGNNGLGGNVFYLANLGFTWDTVVLRNFGLSGRKEKYGLLISPYTVSKFTCLGRVQLSFVFKFILLKNWWWVSFSITSDSTSGIFIFLEKFFKWVMTCKKSINVNNVIHSPNISGHITHTTLEPNPISWLPFPCQCRLGTHYSIHFVDLPLSILQYFTWSVLQVDNCLKLKRPRYFTIASSTLSFWWGF